MPLPFLTKVSGRDPDILAQCPQDEVLGSQMLGLSMMTGGFVHGMSMAASLGVLNVTVPMAIGVALVTGSAIFAVDRLSARATDMRRGIALLAATEGNTVARLSTRWSTFVGGTVRIGFSVVTSVALGAGTALHFYDADLAADIARRQALLDALRLELASAALDRQVEALVAARDLAEQNLSLKTTALGQGQAAAVAQRADLVDQVGQLDDRIAALTGKIDAQRAEALNQDDLAACEAGGLTLGCPEASGKEGTGARYDLAIGRAKAAREEATRAKRPCP